MTTRVVLGRLLFLQAAPMPTPRQIQMQMGIRIGRTVNITMAAITPPMIAPTKRNKKN